MLDRLCAPLCDALLAPDGAGPDAAPAGDSRQVLEALERTNLFLVPLDDEERWFRYHHLFADVLRARLAREAGAGAAAALHRRASAWYGREGLLPEAIQHALAGGAVEDAATWIETLSHTGFANAGVRPALRRWLAAVPEPVVRARPWLCLAQAWLGPEFPRGPTVAWVEAAEQALAAWADHDGRQARGAIAATRAFLATAGSVPAPARARGLAEQALADLRPDEPGFHVASVSLGRAALAQGRLEQAERAFAEAAAAGQAAGFVHLALLARSQHVAIARMRGSRRRALSAARAALAWAHDANTPGAPGVGIVSVLVSDLLRDANDLVAALPLATDGLRALHHYDDPPLVLLASLSLVWLRLARGEVAEAAAVLADARPLVEHAPCTALAPLLDAGEAQVHLSGGDTATAVAWATASEPLPLQDSMAFGGHVFAAGLEAMGVAAARILVVQGRAVDDAALLRQAASRLEPVRQLAERQGLGWLRLKALILRALIDDGLGDRRPQRRQRRFAVAQAEPEGYVRPFVDEGGPLAALLAAWRASERDGRDPTVWLSSNSAGSVLRRVDRRRECAQANAQPRVPPFV